MRSVHTEMYGFRPPPSGADFSDVLEPPPGTAAVPLPPTLYLFPAFISLYSFSLPVRYPFLASSLLRMLSDSCSGWFFVSLSGAIERRACFPLKVLSSRIQTFQLFSASNQLCCRPRGNRVRFRTRELYPDLFPSVASLSGTLASLGGSPCHQRGSPRSQPARIEFLVILRTSRSSLELLSSIPFREDVVTLRLQSSMKLWQEFSADPIYASRPTNPRFMLARSIMECRYTPMLC